MENEMTVSSLVAAFPETKSQIENFAIQMVNSALDGWSSPLKVETQLVCMEKTIEAIRKNPDFKAAVMNEAEKYGSKSFEENNAQYTIKETGVKYDFSQCGYSAYNDLVSEIERLSEQKKKIETFLKSIAPNTEFIDPQSGEMALLQPPSKQSTTSLSITIKK